jgi:hypothetical protein
MRETMHLFMFVVPLSPTTPRDGKVLLEWGRDELYGQMSDVDKQ